jgi:cell division protein FtsI/penicillin-binding protein 2
MKSSAKLRALLACCGFAVCFTTYSLRLIQLQICKHDEYAALAAEKHVNKQTIYARRGVIYDANGEVLADNEPVKTVVADCSLLPKEKRAFAARLLSKPLGIAESSIVRKLDSDRRYIIIKKRISESVAADISARLQEHSLRGIYFEQDFTRIYPNGSMLCHVLGFLNHNHEGVQGIERVMDDYLRGHDGFRFTERDRTGKEIVPYRGQERPPRNGFNVQLTIDMGLQSIVENELETAIRQFRPKAAIAIFMRPSTGEVLALANYPNFNPNQLANVPAECMRNRAITDMVEPGSTFKIVTAAGALNERIVTPSSMIFCENGRFRYGGRSLRDHHGYGMLTVEDVIAKSSNIGTAKLAIQMGDQKVYQYIRRFGFGDRTGISLPGEIAGMVHPPHRWSKISITRIPMGHEVAVTPLQMLTAMCAVANRGRLMTPQIVRDMSDDHGAKVAEFPPAEVRQVSSAKAAEQVCNALKRVVSEQGTAALANISGFTVAGKTGTAQKVDPSGGYLPGKYVLSFVGFFPAEKPEIAGLVMLDEAATQPGMNYGGLVAAPIFARIGERAAGYLNLEHGIIITQSHTP